MVDFYSEGHKYLTSLDRERISAATLDMYGSVKHKMYKVTYTHALVDNYYTTHVLVSSTQTTIFLF